MPSPPASDALSRDESVLVTGITSYVGVKLASRLAAEGRRVIGIVRPTSDTSRLANIGGVELVEHDGSTQGMVDLFDRARPGQVVHLAAHYVRDHAVADVEPVIRGNVLFGTQVLEGMVRSGCRDLVVASSFHQYFESDQYRPINLYAAAKQAFLVIGEYHRDAHRVRSVQLVLYHVYGPGDWRRRLLDAAAGAQESGESLPVPEEDPLLELTHVDDVVDAFMTALRLLRAAPASVDGREFAVRGHRLRLSELLDVIEEVGNAPVPRIVGGFSSPPRSVTVPWSGQMLPGWEPGVALREGIAAYLAERRGR